MQQTLEGAGNGKTLIRILPPRAREAVSIRKRFQKYPESTVGLRAEDIHLYKTSM